MVVSKWFLGFVCALATAMAGVVLAQPGQSAPGIVAIRAARLFDGKADAAIADAVVLVQGTRISAVGSRLAIPPGAQVIVYATKQADGALSADRITIGKNGFVPPM